MNLGQTRLQVVLYAAKESGDVPRSWWWIVLAAGALFLTGCDRPGDGKLIAASLQNVSFDLSRDLFTNINSAVAPRLAEQLGRPVKISQSHAGASKQARSVIEGVEADVVTLNTVSDIDSIARISQKLPPNWRSLKPFNSAPYSSVVVLVVRKGNPKKLRDWDDLVATNVQIALPNPKTSGTGRMIYLSAWAFALRRLGGDESKAEEFLAKFYARAPALDAGSRGATLRFAKQHLGDALITLEVEHHFLVRESPDEGFEAVYPSLSVDVEMPVAVVESGARKHGLLAVANAYLDFLYLPEAQEIIARHHFRPRDLAVRQRYAANFPEVHLVDVDRDLGGWDVVMARHFGRDGLFERAYDRPR